ncbi:MAG: radical SAM protein [Candidatus Shapirobacteria bacterium]|nr:radical SAM protein [Candidatus Shapirobacteria bacterium]
MDLFQRISILGASAQYDTCGPKDFGGSTNIPGVYRASVGSGRICRLFKILQTNACLNNCRYCAFRKDRDYRRVRMSAEEMARSFILVHSRRLVEGLFLSSGLVGSADQTLAPMIDTAQILRRKYHYQGYIHLKIMPDSSEGAIKAAVKLANRVSVNIEAPNQTWLARLSPDKNLNQSFFPTLKLIKKAIDDQKCRWQKTTSLTSQFVVGADQETDQEIIGVSSRLYRQFNLSRVFYSAFRPVAKTPFSHRRLVSPVREHRLYQADFLLRFYRFTPGEIPYGKTGFLALDQDPKNAWVKQNQDCFPINVNRADYWHLLRVPGLGPRSARKIIALRNQRRIFSFSNLTGLRIQKKAQMFLSF